jgi:hypothetical protein
MDAANIEFDPSAFRTRHEEKPFKDAMQAHLDDIDCHRPVRGPKQLELEFQLPANSFLSYKKFVQEPKKELPETSQKRKRCSVPKQALIEITPSIILAALPLPDDVASAPISIAQMQEADDEEFLCSALYNAAVDALNDRNIHSAKKTLWKSCEDIEAQAHYPHKARSIFKCASKIIQNPNYFPSQIKGGVKSPANNPQFIAYCTEAMTKHDTTALNCLYGEELTTFFRKCHHEFYHANPFVQHEILTGKCVAKIKKKMRLISNSLNFVSCRRFVI